MFPLGGEDPRVILERLAEFSRGEPEPSGGRMFAHSYETGDAVLRRLLREAYELYMDKTMLNFVMYPSILRLEREVVRAVASLMDGGEEVTGNFTYGGTESIMLAVKASREAFRASGKTGVPEVILPYTAHPAFLKAAVYLGLKPVFAPVDLETGKVDVDAVNEKVGGNTALIVGSAPNYPYGSVDDIRGLSDIALDSKVLLHVDACIGGFILPFLRDLGERVPDFTFKLEGVTSISVDLHKYGYALKGASVVLFRSRDLRKHNIFVGTRWPGYPLVNTAILSTRSAGTLAASWAAINYLGYKGYLKMAGKVLNAKRKLVAGLENLGLKIVGKPESSIVAFTGENVNVTLLSIDMARRGWRLQVQPGSLYLNFPPTLHMTISPIHESSMDAFLKDLEETLREHKPPAVEEALKHVVSIVEREGYGKALEALGIRGDSIISGESMLLINELIRLMPPDIVEEALAEAVNILI
ncbi:MAG: aspartate aminotransferase family protein [Thermoprotei archaeon]|nr:aspartate aminotransferase family protein [Thermoprotei archaeon]